MTHSHYRQGTYSDLCDDFVVLGFSGRDFPDLRARLHQFKDIGVRHQPVNVPGIESWHHLVYDSKEKVRAVLTDLATADLGLSVTVSGLRDQVAECCQAAGLTPHTVNQSLGFWGKTERLPPFSVLEITTMCGHGRIPPKLVWDLATQVQRQALSAGEASRKLGKLCLCNIFNEVRAARLMGKLVADLQASALSPPQPSRKAEAVFRKDFGITVDQAKCTGCLECIPYCPMSAIVESPAGDAISIDTEQCTECGMCLQVCPVDAIVARDLTYPRTMRGIFHNLHAPYRATPVLAQVSAPVSPTGVGQIVISYHLPTELSNDVNGFFRQGEAGIVIEMGRPHLGTTFRDVQKVTRALASSKLQIDPRSPLTDLIADTSKGILRQDILDEKTGWVVLRLIVPEKEVPRVLHILQQVGAEIETIFALGIVSYVGNGDPPVADRITGEIGIKPAPNCKTNVGLGRPLAAL